MKNRSAPSRRSALKAVAAVAPGLVGVPLAAQSPRPRPFVLVHGAWHGGWCWRRVADRLERVGHKVYAPTLTGLADRSHLLDSRVNLDTHIADVANLIKWEGLTEVVLCGHSYAGFVVSGVAEQIGTAVAAVVLVDAYLPRDGQSLFDIATPASRASLEVAIKRGDVARQAPTAASFNVNPRDQSWVDSKMTPHPVASSTQKVTLTGALERVQRKAYVRATANPNPTFDRFLAEVRRQGGWRTFEGPCGHDVMVDRPDELVDVLLAMA
jgi:pimeloyl-ACP methyl ester carboxylesterase